jgi:hypothetical protein
VVKYVCTETGRRDAPGLQWIVNELTINAYQALGQSPAADAPADVGDVSIVVAIRGNERDFEVLVKNMGAPTLEDEREICRRFRDYHGTRREVEALRSKHTGPDGIVRIPGARGGGGLAILECIRESKEQGLFFDFRIERSPSPTTVFRIASYPESSCGKKDERPGSGRGDAPERAPDP